MGVHSRNSSTATSLGLSQREFCMSWAVSPSPQRPLVRSGRLRNGQAVVVSCGNCSKSRRFNAGLKPARTRGEHEGSIIEDADQERVETSGTRHVAADDELLSLVETELEPIPGAVAGPVRADAALGHDALKALTTDGFDELGGRNIERLGIANQIAQFRHELAAERVAAFFKRETAHIFAG